MRATPVRALLCALIAIAACGDDGSSPPIDAPASVEGTYHRIVPGFTTEPECRAAHPDPLFNCIEVVDLCPAGVAETLFTDIVSRGTWSQLDAPLRVRIVIASTPELTVDGEAELEVRSDRSLFSTEVYGNKPFVPGGDGLCAP
jgi:hypothetical protein